MMGFHNSRRDPTTRPPQQGSPQELRRLLKQFDTAMLVTLTPEGMPRARPMAMQANEEAADCDLFFVTSDASPKMDDIKHDTHVGVVCVRPGDNAYVSISADCWMDRNRAEIARLFKPSWKAWFPDGKDDPHIALLKLHVRHAEYWEPGSKLTTLMRAVAAVVTREPAGNLMPAPKAF